MKKALYIIIMLTVTIAACNSSEKKLRGTWVINKVYYHDRPATYDLLSNAFELKKDNTCGLPIWRIEDSNTDFEKGNWNAFTRSDTLYLQIKSINKIFNRTFKVSDFRTVTDSVSFGSLTKATLSSDSIKIECTMIPR